jgi:hypothetical protein
MSLLVLSTILGVFSCLLQFGIGWYGWRNPRPQLMIVRKIFSGVMFAWALFSVYRVIIPDMAPIEQIAAERGMAMWIAMYAVTLAIMGTVFIIVRKKYFQRMEEIGPQR